MVKPGREIADRVFVMDLDDGMSVAVHCKQVTGKIELAFPSLPSEQVSGEQSYIRIERERHSEPGKRRKTIASGPGNSTRVTIDPDHFFMQYDQLFFVDTNTMDDARTGEKTSIVSMMVAFRDPEFNEEPDRNRILYYHCSLTEIRNTLVSPEKIGWKLAIDAIQCSKYAALNTQIALVVDAHLGEHKALMRREIPLFGDEYLPTNIDLIYASADTGAESALNYLMKRCDAAAKYVMKHVLEEQPSDAYFPASDPKLYEKSRTWTVHTSAVGKS